MDAVGVEVKFCRALQRLSDEFSDHKGAKALAQRGLHDRPVAFDPLELDATVGLRASPTHQHVSLRRR